MSMLSFLVAATYLFTALCYLLLSSSFHLSKTRYICYFYHTYISKWMWMEIRGFNWHHFGIWLHTLVKPYKEKHQHFFDNSLIQWLLQYPYYGPILQQGKKCFHRAIKRDGNGQDHKLKIIFMKRKNGNLKIVMLIYRDPGPCPVCIYMNTLLLITLTVC